MWPGLRPARRAWPPGKELCLFPGKVVITVHAPLTGSDAEAMTQEAQKAIESALDPRFHAPKGVAAEAD